MINQKIAPVFIRSALMALVLVATAPLHAQVAAQAKTQQTAADFIVALVNSEPVMHSELRNQMQLVAKQTADQGRARLSEEAIRSAALESLITLRAQLQFARESGVRVDEASVDQAEQAIAAQNQMGVEALRKQVAQDGVSASAFRNQLREQIMLTRVRERDVEGRMRISDADVDRAMEEQQAANTNPANQNYNIAQILITLPENPTTDQVQKAQAQAQSIVSRAQAGESFEKLVEQWSAADKKEGGKLGLRRVDRYPPVFIAAVQALEVSGVAQPVRTNAGIHVLKLIERSPAPVVMSMPQSKARHILLTLTPQLSQAQAQQRLTELRRAIVAGSTTFEAAARQFSQDGSAPQGGDLGWVNPGSFVPEFEQAMDRLKDREISQPVVSRFGVHLIQLLERRKVDLTVPQQREVMRNQLRAKRIEEKYISWSRDIRERAYVELRANP